MEKKDKIYSIDIIRILACISVYTHHYLGMELEPAKAGYIAFYKSDLFKYMLGICSGGYAVIAFFVIAGFFMSYNTCSKPMLSEDYGKKCVYKCMNIIIPSFLVITVTAMISLPMKAAGIAEIFSLKEYFLDIFKLIMGIQGDKHIHYAYPLWFQHFIFVGYIWGYIFLYVFRRNRKSGLLIYFPVLIYLLFNSEYNFMIFMGLLAGELCSGRYERQLRRIFGNTFLNIFFLMLLSMAMSVTIEENYDLPKIYGPSTMLFALLLVIVYCMNKAAEGKKKVVIEFLSSNSYSCYLIHFFWMCSFMRIVYHLFLRRSGSTSDTVICIVMYIIMTISLWIAGFLFNRFALVPLKASYDRIWTWAMARLMRY